MATFLLLFGYIGVCGLIALLYFTGVLHQLGIISRLEQIWSDYSPEWMRNFTDKPLPRWVCYLCCALYHVVILGSHILGISDVVPLADQKVTKSTFNHPAIMYHMWFIHTIFYLLCTFTSQGVISKRNYKDACQAYDYDGQWYKSETKCRTCDVVKPARSKHCSICDVCVFRFDHHCLWIHCCIGGRNYRYFIALLLTALMMAVNGSVMCYLSLHTIYTVKQLSTYKYMSADGSPQPLGGVVLVQYLFHGYPRLFLLGTSLLLLSVLLAVFIGYHFYLILRNTTTNESYKTSTAPPRSENDGGRSFYDRGILGNLTEILFPIKLESNSTLTS